MIFKVAEREQWAWTIKIKIIIKKVKRNLLIFIFVEKPRVMI